MNEKLGTCLCLAVVLCTTGCETPHFLTVKVHESPDKVVRLQAIPDARHGQGFSHPAFLTEEQVEKVLEGLVVERHTSAVSMPFMSSGRRGRGTRAFSDTEILYFAPLLTKGLTMATPDEVVTFFETADISKTQRVITSGAIFLIGDEFHVVLSNHRVKTGIWTDVEHYEPPFRIRPLEPIQPEPGRLFFQPSQYMVQSSESPLKRVIGAQHYHVGVLYREAASQGKSKP